MTVIINEFEVIPAQPPANQQTGPAQPPTPPPSPTSLVQETERIIGRRQERLARIRAH